ncbi:hypothetical protein jhhlp_002660 [Lomentospora prolificans]|uniref:Iron-sulfur assembly protein 1 n=1 Tax=Lomentospora prolificans TaxID=41688 RepID=A0A2N3NEW3_9PEZI|nr:hypothetical protein jhhlp_002660 [Lomentospora prolificans]
MLARQTLTRTAVQSTRLLLRLPATQAGKRFIVESRTSTPSPAAYDIPAAWYSSSAAEATITPKSHPQAYPLRQPAAATPTPQEREAAASHNAQVPTPTPAVETPSQQSPAPSQTQQKAATEPKSQQKPRRTFRALRPRKAAMTLSADAVRELRRLLDLPEPKLIKVGVKQKGCSGLAYNLEYVDKPSALDEVVEQDGVKLVIDNRALMSVIGSEMHWQEDMLSKKFVFRNPNIKQSCGCGESFMV